MLCARSISSFWTPIPSIKQAIPYAKIANFIGLTPLRCVISFKAQKIVSRTVEYLSHLDELFGWDFGFAGLPAFECVIADTNGLGKTGLSKPGSRNLGIDVRVKQDTTFLSIYPVWVNFNFIVIPYGLYVNRFLKLFPPNGVNFIDT